jgi:hypothetical protein
MLTRNEYTIQLDVYYQLQIFFTSPEGLLFLFFNRSSGGEKDGKN